MLESVTANEILVEVEAAEQRIRPHIRRTYLEPSVYYSQLTGANVYFKCENLQHTGSFKARGALSKVLSLDKAERARGVVSASTGNHGAAVAFAANKVGATALIFVPDSASPSKLAAIGRLGADIQVHGADSVEAEAYARAFASENGLAFISPYNDPQVIGGQGTIGLELAQQCPNVDAVFVAVGGGGLIAGIAVALKDQRPEVRIVGCSPEHSQVMIQSVMAGEILDLPSQPTLSDGTAGGVEAGSITFPLCRDLVDTYETASEEEIADHLRQFMAAHHQLIEGSAAVPIAALLKRRDEFAGQNVFIVLCGANIDLETMKKILG
ncbi:MAG: threonine/serine dehydratase [Chloroflexota bacterium]|nr:MAG: threonine/serine dehydratase [Chloroflexota bacterium]